LLKHGPFTVITICPVLPHFPTKVSGSVCFNLVGRVRSQNQFSSSSSVQNYVYCTEMHYLKMIFRHQERKRTIKYAFLTEQVSLGLWPKPVNALIVISNLTLEG